MKRSGILLLVGGLMAGVFSITGYTTAGAEALTSQLPTISQGGGFENQPPQLEPFDKACEESIREFYLRLAQEKEPQLEPFDKASEESTKEFYLKVARERQRVDSEFTLAK